MVGEVVKSRQARPQNQKRVFGYLLITLVAQVMADGLITRFLITNGLATESNPFLRSLADNDKLLAVKLAGSVLCACLLWVTYKRKPRISLVVTTVGVICYTLILYWNLAVFYMTAY